MSQMRIVDNGTTDFNFPIPIKVPKRSLVSVRGITKNATNEVTTVFELYTKVE